LPDSIRRFEVERIVEAFAEGRTVSGTARILGITRQNLQMRMRRLGLSLEDVGAPHAAG